VLFWNSKRNILLFKSVLHEDRCLLLCFVSVDLLRNYTFNLLWRIGISYSAERFGIIEFQPLSFRSVRIT